ncbi:MAG TPA: aminotransferase class I/II-fold pyridoxal phosphate-dependent enzyme [Actinomycetota bacterium]
MSGRAFSKQIEEIGAIFGPVAAFFDTSQRWRREAGPGVSDFRAGDPQEMALDAYVETIRKWATPQSPSWFAYTQSAPWAQEVVAKSVRERLGLEVEPEDVVMTNGAIGGLAVTFRVIADPGDEIIIISPPHFLYEPLIRAAGANAVRVRMDEETFDLDVDAIEAAITDRTRGVVVNTPHNPTGRIYPTEVLDRLAGVLRAASERQGRPVYQISDEAYNRIVFDGREFVSPATRYENTLLIYTFGKTLLAPGHRVGYVVPSPGMKDKEGMRAAFLAAQVITGWAFPNTILQHALGDLEPLSVDVEHLQRRRDLMVEGLRERGYELHAPESTFYLLPRSPDPDDWAFTERLAHDGVLVMPGGLLETPGYFRISLTASDDMIERAWPAFERAIART